MKRYLLVLIFCFTGVMLFAQNMDLELANREYTRAGASFSDRLAVLERVRDSGQTGAGEFYHSALRLLLQRIGNERSAREQAAAEMSAIILCRGLAAENFTGAAAEIWQTVTVFDINRPHSHFEGLAMQAAIIALGQIDSREYIPHIVRRLEAFNTQNLANEDIKRKVQRVVIGCINALETFKDPNGFRPLFYASIGSYDPVIKERAANAFLNIIEDPADIVIGIIQSPANNASIKSEALKATLRMSIPETSKARVAAAALATGWIYSTSNRQQQTILREFRKTAIDAIHDFGAADASVYVNLEKSYENNFVSASPDFDEIYKTLTALAAIKTDEGTQLLNKFLQELHHRRRNGPWGNKERSVFERVIFSLGSTGTQSMDVRFLLTSISHSDEYTWVERNMATDALRNLGFVR
ncbi:MAG: hypothetical protein FWD40_05535 [Treponema sp.]|nr:hypothetical protein [Treponema sp.]